MGSKEPAARSDRGLPPHGAPGGYPGAASDKRANSGIYPGWRAGLSRPSKGPGKTVLPQLAGPAEIMRDAVHLRPRCREEPASSNASPASVPIIIYDDHQTIRAAPAPVNSAAQRGQIILIVPATSFASTGSHP